jgi:hypothetical protein
MKSKSPLHHKRWTLRLLEWGVLVCVTLVLMGVFLRKVRHLQAEAERLNVQATVANLRASVLLASVLPKHKETARSEARSGGNPVALLKLTAGLEPDGYLGELADVDLDQIAPGKWYFDCSQRALIYRLRSAAGFASPLAGPARIRLCLRQADTSKTGAAPLQLEACESYRWGAAN